MKLFQFYCHFSMLLTNLVFPSDLSFLEGDGLYLGVLEAYLVQQGTPRY